MRYMKAFGLIPIPVFYTDSNLSGYAGRDYWLFIRINKKYRDDEGLHQHELVHIEQTYKGLVIGHFLLYHLWRKYRLWAEARAYREQMKYKPTLTIEDAAKYLATKYDLYISIAEAKKALVG